MINLLFDARAFESTFSGIAKTTLLLYSALNSIYGDAINFSGMYRKKLYSELPDYIKTTRAFFPIKKYSAFNIRHAMRISKSEYIHFPINGEMPFGMIPGKKISTIHDVLPLEIPGYFQNKEGEMSYRRKMQSNINRTDLVFTPSLYSKNRIYEEFKVSVPVIVLPWAGASIQENYFESIRAQLNKPYYLYAGGYDERKGIANLLKAILILRNRVDEDFHVLFVGKKRKLNDETESLLARCKNENLIEELGYVTEQELSGLYQGAIGLCFLSKYEGFGLTPLEAMTNGCPVITTRYTSLPEVCGDAALYVEPDNPDEVAIAMEKILDNETRERLINDGFKQSSSFSWKNSADVFMTNIMKL